ncbi:MAG: helix-turn-helix transcriptional regulator [Bdellovibrionales bacterium]
MTNSTNYSKNSAFFLLIFGLTLADVVLDFRSGVSIKHLLVEFIVLFVSLLAFNFYLDRLKVNQSKVKNQIDRANEQVKNSMIQLEGLKHELSHFKNQFKDEIDQQFSDWKFSRAEAEVSLLLLKGLSLKEIADTRGSNEKTVRAQCTSIYKKSNLSGRHQLSSYFLDFIF